MNAMNDFKSLNLPDFLIRAIDEARFVTPTPIQAKAIPPALAGSDILASAQTGTGKTAAFVIPMLVKLNQHPQGLALVLAPTREIALQIKGVLEDLGGNRFGIALLIGGQSMQPQTRALFRRPRIIVGTPGRVIDHLRRRSLNLGTTFFAVLDEADRMLDMGFAPQVNAIMDCLPATRQTLFFSATFPPDAEKLASRRLKKPVRIAVGPVSKPIELVRQSMIMTQGADKKEVLLDELNARPGSALVFTRTKHRADRVTKFLESYGIAVARIHGDRTQGQRVRALEGFRAGEFRVLVATDIAARGLDIEQIGHVINFDLPQCADDFVHRIGRTGRAGTQGAALSLVGSDEKHLWRDILRLFPDSGRSIAVKQLERGKQLKMPDPKRQPLSQAAQTGTRTSYSRNPSQKNRFQSFGQRR